MKNNSDVDPGLNFLQTKNLRKEIRQLKIISFLPGDCKSQRR
jgi:hypothetical protein